MNVRWVMAVAKEGGIITRHLSTYAVDREVARARMKDLIPPGEYELETFQRDLENEQTTLEEHWERGRIRKDSNHAH
jgi:hypothetical protein